MKLRATYLGLFLTHTIISILLTSWTIENRMTALSISLGVDLEWVKRTIFKVIDHKFALLEISHNSSLANFLR